MSALDDDPDFDVEAAFEAELAALGDDPSSELLPDAKSHGSYGDDAVKQSFLTGLGARASVGTGGDAEDARAYPSPSSRRAAGPDAA